MTQVAGKPKAAVEKVLGKADACETVSPSKVGKVPKCVFKGGRVEVVFINGKADWITVRAPSVRFDQEALAALGCRLGSRTSQRLYHAEEGHWRLPGGVGLPRRGDRGRLPVRPGRDRLSVSVSGELLHAEQLGEGPDGCAKRLIAHRPTARISTSKSKAYAAQLRVLMP